MARSRRFGSVVLAACCFAGSAVAQTVQPQTFQTQAQPQPPANPFAPSLSDAERAREQERQRPDVFLPESPTAPVRQPARFVRPASGAGQSGFDSTNARKKRAVANPGIGVAVRTVPARDGETTTTPSLPTSVAEPAPLSPYQKPIPLAAQTAYAARTPIVPVGAQPAASIAKRKKLVAEGDPYEPMGVRAGAFDLYPAVELFGGYDTNPGARQNAQGSVLGTVAPELRAQSNWSRHELKADLRGSYTYYDRDTTPSVSRPRAEGRVDGRIDITRDTRANLGARLFLGTDYPNSPNLQAGLSRLPIYTTVGGIVGLAHRFNRLEIAAKGTLDRTVWQKSSLVDGTTASNDDRNFNQYGGALRATYETLPGVAPYIEGSADRRVHDLNADFFGLKRNSNGVTGRVGSTFELTRLLTGDVSVGYTQRTYEDPRLDAVKGLVFDGALKWSATQLTTVRLTGKTDIAESNVFGVSGIFRRDVGLAVDHAFRRWLIATVKFGFGLDSYQVSNAAAAASVIAPDGRERQDQRYAASLALTYKLNRELWFKGEVRREWLTTNVTGFDYTANVFLLGLRLQR